MISIGVLLPRHLSDVESDKYDSRITPIAASNKHECELIAFANDTTLSVSATDKESLILKLQTMTERVYH